MSETATNNLLNTMTATARTKKPSVKNKKPLAKKKIVKQGKELEGKPSFTPSIDPRYGRGDWD